MNKFVRIFASIIAVSCLFAALYLYNRYVAGTDVPTYLEENMVNIPTNSSFEEVIEILTAKELIKNETTFRFLSEKMNYKRSPMRSGRFEVEPGWSMVDLIRHLRNGEQAPVTLVLTNERLLEEVAAKVARFIEPDSAEFMAIFNNDSYLKEIGYTKETLMSLFIPNSYEFYWNSSAADFMDRMIKEHKNFWKQDDRLQKAKALNMEPQEVYTLAAIVERETQNKGEKPRMAGVYLNRLEIGMRLQADPTCVFATRDFGTRRVTNYHLKFDSPYNTYLYAGLPPGPISMASIASLDAVLNAEDHDYIYFCAKGDGSGLHAFAKTLSGHNQNAAKYRQNLKKRGLR